MSPQFQIQGLEQLQKKLHAYAPEFFSLILFFLLVYQIDLTWFNTHMARDLMRADLGVGGWLGPEMGWDVLRLPGPAYYWFLKPFTWLSSVPRILFAKALITTFTVYFLLDEFRRHYAKRLIIAFCFLFIAVPLFVLSSRNLWNPSWVIPLNSLFFGFFLRFCRLQDGRSLWICFLIGVFGIQIHFSAILIFASAWITVFWFPPKNQHRWHLLGMLVFLVVWLGAWCIDMPRDPLHQQMNSFYGLRTHFLNRLQDLSSFFATLFIDIRDYDIFNFLSDGFWYVSGQSLFVPMVLSKVVAYVLLLLSLVAIVYAIPVIRRKKDLRVLFAIIHFFVFLFSLLIFQGKEHLPYRYGFALFPVQFFLVAWWFQNLNQRFRKFLLPGFTLVFFLNLFWVFTLIEAQGLLKRSHHATGDTLELNLREKRNLYRHVLESHPTAPEPFIFLHGRTANKMRLKEMNWDQTDPYFYLWKTQSGNYPSLKMDLADYLSESSSLVHLDHQTVEILALTEAQLPKNIRLSFLDANEEILGFRDWKNSNLILPMAFFESPEKVEEILLQFELPESESRFLNLLVDHSDRAAPEHLFPFQVLELRELGEPRQPLQIQRGGFLVQTQFIYELPKNRTAHYELRLKVFLKHKNFSRIDLFTTPNLMPAEEIRY